MAKNQDTSQNWKANRVQRLEANPLYLVRSQSRETRVFVQDLCWFMQKGLILFSESIADDPDRWHIIEDCFEGRR